MGQATFNTTFHEDVTVDILRAALSTYPGSTVVRLAIYAGGVTDESPIEKIKDYSDFDSFPHIELGGESDR